MSHKKYRTETDCLNCGAEVQGKFCSNCGQENLEVRENFFHVAFHFISDYFHFDSKFFRSLVPLFTKPGFLTKQYWDGKRVRYIHPLRLYFFAIIVAVLCTSFFYNHFDNVKGRMIRPSVTFTPDSTEMEAARQSKDSAAYIEALRVKTVAETKEKTVASIGGGLDNFVRDLKYISFFLLPVYALIFKLLYTRRKAFYVDHLVYTMHLQSFAMLTMGLLLLIPLLIPVTFDWITRLTYVAIFVYIVISLRNLYNQSWVKTILKSIIAMGLTVFTMAAVMGIYLSISLLSSQITGKQKINFKGNAEYQETKKEQKE